MGKSGDLPLQELIAGGDERHAAGKHAEAARLYRRALWSPSDYTRAITLERLIRCCGEIDDNQGAIDAALQMLDYDPHAWFGEYDYAVAQAVLLIVPPPVTKPAVGS